jgi:hypothetical protein
MLCHYGDTIVHNVNNNITYNDENNFLLNGNLIELVMNFVN